MPNPTEIRCPNCQKKIADAVGPTDIKCVCPRCKTDFDYSNIEAQKTTVKNETKNGLTLEIKRKNSYI